MFCSIYCKFFPHWERNNVFNNEKQTPSHVKFPSISLCVCLVAQALVSVLGENKTTTTHFFAHDVVKMHVDSLVH